jgi:hypothetical protein
LVESKQWHRDEITSRILSTWFLIGMSSWFNCLKGQKETDSPQRGAMKSDECSDHPQLSFIAK